MIKQIHFKSNFFLIGNTNKVLMLHIPDKYKHISDISYQKYASFYGEEAHVDLEFKNKLAFAQQKVT